MGSKYPFKPLNDGPGPGAYAKESKLTMSRVRGTGIQPEPERKYYIDES